MRKTVLYTSNAGLSLVEILVAVFLLGVAAVAMVGLTSLGTRLSIESERQTVAQAVVNEKIEFVRSLTYEDVGYADAAGDEPDGVLTRQETARRNQQDYGLDVLIEIIDDAGNQSLPSGGLNEFNADYKRVTIEASWVSAGGNERSVAATTLVSAGGNFDTCTPGAFSCPGGEACPANGVCPSANADSTCPSEGYFCGGVSSQPIYLTNQQQLFVYDNDQAQSIGNYTGLTGGVEMVDVAIDSSGQLYGIADFENDPNAPTKLYSVNKANAAVTFIADVDTQFNHFYTSAGFLSDGRLAIGGPNRIRLLTLTNGTVTDNTIVDLANATGSVQFSGDLVERNGSVWFTGYTSSTSGDLCFEADIITGTTTQLSLLPVGSSKTALGAVCETSACDTVRIFTRSGITKWVDAGTCQSYPGEAIGTTWTGAAR